MSKICKQAKQRLIESWIKLRKRIDKRKIEISEENRLKQTRRLEKEEIGGV
jgi:phage regulator Rha-like protein